MPNNKKPSKKPIEQYDHRAKQRVNNPPVGLVTPETDRDVGKKTYAYDPHLDPELQWAGKAEHTSFEVRTVSLHVHERIDPRTIIEAVRKTNGPLAQQLSLFASPQENPPIRQAIEFYKHKHNWTNRLIAGDSLLVMNSLLEKEGMAGKVQMIYIDPPYGIKYGSNFQPFVNKRDVKDGKDDDLTAEPEQIRAFRDTWELGIHSYLTYLRDRLLLSRELLTESGSIFVQIGEDNVHHVRELTDEVFQAANSCRIIAYMTTSFQADRLLANTLNYLLWYAKDKALCKARAIFRQKQLGDPEAGEYRWVRLVDGTIRPLTNEEHSGISPLPQGARAFRYGPLTSQGYSETGSGGFSYLRKTYSPGANQHWKVGQDGLNVLAKAGLLLPRANSLSHFMFLDDFPVTPIGNNWTDTKWGFDAGQKSYVVQTNAKVIQRCVLMTTDPGDLVLDPTCGSGTTAFVAEQWGRRWITCDTSRVALTLARQRLMTAIFDYYELAHPEEGVGSGFKYKTVPHITLKSIANNPEIREGMTRAQIDAAIARHAEQETLYDQPFLDRKKVRVSGPFTVEAVPAPAVRSLDQIVPQASPPAYSSRDKAKSAGETPALPTPGGNAGETPALPALLSGWHERGYLPHLKAEGATYFVTFRLADTLPQQVLESYRLEREEIVKGAQAMGRELTLAEEKRLAELYSERIESHLDAGHGKCWLREPEIARLVADALQRFDGERYDLHAWVVMPNHVHVVLTPREGHTLTRILQNWKSFTAHEAQKVPQASSPAPSSTGVPQASSPASSSVGVPQPSRPQIPKGDALWQRECYDHLIRDEADFARVCRYTVDNPVKAGLCDKPEHWPYVGVAQASRLQTHEAQKVPQASSPASSSVGVAQASSPASSSGDKGDNAGEDACGTVADASIARSGETLRQAEWRDELLRTGIRGKRGQYILFSRVEPLPGTRWLHADAETKPNNRGADSVREEGPVYGEPVRAVISFGPEHAPLEQRQVALAIEEAQTLVPKPKIIIFAAFQFDPEAAKDIDETDSPGVTLLKAQMNADLLTEDLKKKRASNESFWLIGQPDMTLEQIKKGKDKGKYTLRVLGFDYYNTKTGTIESGGSQNIAMWMLDTDYDGRSLLPRQVFFPMAGDKEGWSRLARTLRSEIDEELIEAYRGTVSLPFEVGENRRIAVKIVDDRGIESLRILEVE